VKKLNLFKVFTSKSCSDAVNKVLESGFIGQGPKVDLFESLIQSHFNTNKRIITLNSCTAALDLAYELIGVNEGDTVISTPMTCVATNTPLYNRKANIIWADVDPITGLIDPNDIAKKINSNVKAIVCVDWCGNPCDYDALRKFGIPIVEDAAHAINTQYNGTHIANSGGDYVCWSFQAIKHLTCGDGGALVVPKDKVENAVKMRWYGFDRTLSSSFRCAQDITTYGNKYHMNDIAATIGIENLKYTNSLVQKSIFNSKKYSDNINNKKVNVIPFDNRSSYWIYTTLVDDKESFIKYMTENNIEVSPVHNRNDNYTIFKKFKTELPNLDTFFSKQIAIPNGWWLTEKEIDYIIKTINNWK